MASVGCIVLLLTGLDSYEPIWKTGQASLSHQVYCTARNPATKPRQTALVCHESCFSWSLESVGPAQILEVCVCVLNVVLHTSIFVAGFTIISEFCLLNVAFAFRNPNDSASQGLPLQPGHLAINNYTSICDQIDIVDDDLSAVR